jgi:hypothetical protein
MTPVFERAHTERPLIGVSVLLPCSASATCRSHRQNSLLISVRVAIVPVSRAASCLTAALVPPKSSGPSVDVILYDKSEVVPLLD